ncbi:MAG: general secretion pathway protein GspJ [Polyangiaceae bacterium]|nr:general secretion pathway protein GspJ [Polyangiaceae bacterium]
MSRGASRGGARGLALIEVLVAVGVLALVSMLLYGAFATLRTSRDSVRLTNDRHHEGRSALARIVRELSGAYVSGHLPVDESLIVWKTHFRCDPASPAARLDFTTFAHQRLDRDAHESDQADISYFSLPDPDRSGVHDLVRRVKSRLDDQPGTGGRIEILATDIDLFEVRLLDPLSGQWVESWDTTQAIGQPNRLPLLARIVLVLNGAAREARGGGRGTLRFSTAVPLAAQRALTFATQ